MSLEKENKNLKKENEKLKETTAELRTKVKGYESQWFWTWIFLAFVVGGVPGFFLGRGGRQSQRPNNNTVVPRLDNGLPKCPRCGMEHDPGDTVCKNPNCKTQF